MIRHYSKNIQDIIQRELYAARDSIKIAVAWFTNDLLFYPLLHKLMAGVKVELILNKDDVNFSVSNIVDFDQFLQLGGVLYLNETKRLLHDKFCIIDNRIVISGSYNWTNGAKHNYETINVFTDELESVKHHKELFESLKVGFTRQQASKTNNPKPEASTPRIEKEETSSRITYTSLDECIVEPNEKANFDANIVSNTYEDGKGVIVFDREITAIPCSMFMDCSNLTSVSIPKGVTSIELNAFRGCSSLTNVVIPESVTSIGFYAFEKCSSLAKFEGNFASDDGRCLIVNGVLRFFAPYGLTIYAIPDGVTSIAFEVFYGCSSLTNVVIPESVTSIGDGAFQNCSNLTNVVIHKGVTSIDCFAFWGCSSLVSVVIPESVASIGNGAFCDCSNLTNVVIPESVTSIGDGAFQNCSNLTNVVIPKGVTSIGNNAFSGCSSLSVVIPKGVTSIGLFAFGDCSSFASVVIPEGVTSIGDHAFEGWMSLTSVVIPKRVTSIGCSAFRSCFHLANVVIPEGLTSIGAHAFRECFSLTSVVIPKRVTSIGRLAFSYCSSLAKFEGNFASDDGRCLIVNGVLEAFAPYGLTSYAIPNGVTSIGDLAFRGCSNLTSIVIPEGVTLIGVMAFDLCEKLRHVYCMAFLPPTFACARGLGRIFPTCSNICVPRQSVEAYKNAEGWRDYADAIIGYDF